LSICTVAMAWPVMVPSDGGDLERVKGIEPSSLAWEAKALPLSYTRAGAI
jgi:hypothetical protein